MDDTIASETDSLINTRRGQLRVYRRRWYILCVFTGLGALYNAFWNTWSPIQGPCKAVFGWQDKDFLLVSMWAAVGYIVAAVPFAWLMNSKGLRASVLLSAFLMSVGKVIQAIPFPDPIGRTVLINVGQFVIMTTGPVFLGAPPLLSATWFPSHERTTGTAIASLGAFLGIAIAFAMGPAAVPTILSNSTKNNGTDVMADSISDYLWLEAGLIIFLFLLILVYFPNKPPSPPTMSSFTNHLTGWTGFMALVHNRSFWLLATLSGLSFGVYFGWLSLLDVILAKFHVDPTTAGWLGCGATLAGVVTGILLAKCADMIKHKTKQILVFLLFFTAISQLIFTLTCIEILPPTKAVLFLGIIAGGLFYNGTLPLFLELAVDCVYPVTEGMTGVTIMTVGNFILLVFYVVFMLPNSNVSWMNWVTVAGMAVCVPGLLIYKERYSRLDMDTADHDGDDATDKDKRLESV